MTARPVRSGVPEPETTSVRRLDRAILRASLLFAVLLAVGWGASMLGPASIADVTVFGIATVVAGVPLALLAALGLTLPVAAHLRSNGRVDGRVGGFFLGTVGAVLAALGGSPLAIGAGIALAVVSTGAVVGSREPVGSGTRSRVPPPGWLFWAVVTTTVLIGAARRPARAADPGEAVVALALLAAIPAAYVVLGIAERR